MTINKQLKTENDFVLHFDFILNFVVMKLLFLLPPFSYF